MENKRNVLNLFTLFVGILMTIPVYGETSTPSSVSTFYGGMQRLSQVSDANVAYDICKSMKDCFIGMDVSVSGSSIPNDFRFFDYDKKNSISHEDAMLNSSNYVNRLEEYIYKERVMKVEFHVVNTEVAGYLPEFHKGRLSASNSLMATCVEKTYIIGGFRKVFNDTVLTDYSNGKISEIKNGNGKAVVNITTLRNKAALAYRLKHYYEAYKCYEQIISITPNDADALYRIGLMTYFQYNDCGISKRYRKSKAKEYLVQAQRHGGYYGIGEKAKNVLFWLKYNV